MKLKQEVTGKKEATRGSEQTQHYFCCEKNIYNEDFYLYNIVSYYFCFVYIENQVRVKV